jgi:hypothetical protein
MATSRYIPGPARSIAATTMSAAASTRGQLVVLRTTIAMPLEARFCWYLRFVSVVTSVWKPRLSATQSSSSRTQAVAKALRAACSNTARACSRVMPGNSSTNSPTGTSSSTFSKRAAMGTREPRKTQAPLTRSGSRSTTAQLDQSIMVAIIAPELCPSDGGKGRDSMPIPTWQARSHPAPTAAA